MEIYLPEDTFYDFKTYEKIEGKGEKINLTDIPFTEIPLHIRGGSILPLRNSSAYTTTEVRKQPFNLLVAPSKDGKAKGEEWTCEGGRGMLRPEAGYVDAARNNARKPKYF